MEAKGEMNNNDVGVSSNNFALSTRGSIQRDIAIWILSVRPSVRPSVRSCYGRLVPDSGKHHDTQRRTVNGEETVAGKFYNPGGAVSSDSIR